MVATPSAPPCCPRAYDDLVAATFATAVSDKSQFWNHGFDPRAFCARRVPVCVLAGSGRRGGAPGARSTEMLRPWKRAKPRTRPPTVKPAGLVLLRYGKSNNS